MARSTPPDTRQEKIAYLTNEMPLSHLTGTINARISHEPVMIEASNKSPEQMRKICELMDLTLFPDFLFQREYSIKNSFDRTSSHNTERAVCAATAVSNMYDESSDPLLISVILTE